MNAYSQRNRVLLFILIFFLIIYYFTEYIAFHALVIRRVEALSLQNHLIYIVVSNRNQQGRFHFRRVHRPTRITTCACVLRHLLPDHLAKLWLPQPRCHIHLNSVDVSHKHDFSLSVQVFSIVWYESMKAQLMCKSDGSEIMKFPFSLCIGFVA